MKRTRKRMLTPITGAIFVAISGISLWAWITEGHLQTTHFSRKVGTSQVSCVGSNEWCEALNLRISELEKIETILKRHGAEMAVFEISAPQDSRIVDWTLYDTNGISRREIYGTSLDTSDVPNMTKQEVTNLVFKKRWED